MFDATFYRLSVLSNFVTKTNHTRHYLVKIGWEVEATNIMDHGKLHPLLLILCSQPEDMLFIVSLFSGYHTPLKC